MVKQGVRLGTARDVGKVAAKIGSSIKTGAANAVSDTGDRLLQTKIDKSTITDTGTESIKQGLTELRYADNARKAVQNTARGTIRTAAAVRNMPKETRAQIKRTKVIVQKTADGIRRIVTSKIGGIAAIIIIAVLIIVVLTGGLVSVMLTTVSGTTGWMCPDGSSSDSEITSNIHRYIDMIHEARKKQQSDVDAVRNSLEPEYRYDGTEITGLNKFGESEIILEDANKVLALMAVQKFRNLSGNKTADLHFSDAEVQEAVNCFYDFRYSIIKGHCPQKNCQKLTGIPLRLSQGDFQIAENFIDSTTGKHVVILQGSTYEYVAKYTLHLHIGSILGTEFTGDTDAVVSKGTWKQRLNYNEVSYKLIDWEHFDMTADVLYCDNPEHCYLFGSVRNLTEEEALTKAGLTAEERKLYQVEL